MARKPGERFPSDHRRWFRVTEDIADDPKLASQKDEWIWGAFLRTLAALNRTKSRDGTLRVSYPALAAMMGRSRRDVALKRLGRCVNVGLMTAARYADFVLIMVPKWPIIQGFAPAEPQWYPEKTPPPKKRKKKSEEEESFSEPNSSHKPLLNLLGKEPGGQLEKEQWLEREYPLLQELSSREYPDEPAKRSRDLRSRVIRHYRQHLKNTNSLLGSVLSPAQKRAARTDQAAANVIKELQGAEDESRSPSRNDPSDVPHLRIRGR